MPENLVIVESPTKAKTIKRFLGKDYQIESCFGHIRDLKKKELSVDVQDEFTPIYEIPKEKKKLIAQLKKIAKDTKMVWLATDEDREGEAIAWHLFEVLQLNKKYTQRIVFHEITKEAILKSFENPREIDQNLVDAQQARRILDRLVGYEVSPVLWRKVKPALSAGRVQSVAVKLIVEKENGIDNFNPESYFKTIGQFETKGISIKSQLIRKFRAEKETFTFLESCKGASYHVEDIITKPVVRKPAPPFTTSSLQQEAGRLGYSVSRTMQLAQKLYEAGHITYMRTDSFNLSKLALAVSAKVITSSYGKEYHQPRKYKTTKKSAQEAHEAIRPTYIEKTVVSEDSAQQKIYTLIRNRMLASQMANAKLEKKQVKISISTNKNIFEATGETLLFDGFLKISGKKNISYQSLLPELKKGEELALKEIIATHTYTSAPGRYNEASLVKKMEDLGIGRPSTYAPTITNIQKKDYVVKKNEAGIKKKIKILKFDGKKTVSEHKEITADVIKNKLFPTETGIIVTEFLNKHFKKIMDYGFTARAEENFDNIALGNQKWKALIREFYSPFHENVENVKKTAEKHRGERLLGDDPKSGKPVFVKIGRYGPMVQIGELGDKEKPKFASLQPSQKIKNITLEEALDLFKLPKELGTFEDEKISVGVGKFGPYIKHKTVYASIPNDINISEITLSQAIHLIKEKNKIKANKNLGLFEEKEITTGKGRFGPYVKHDKLYVSIPRELNLSEVTLEKAIELIIQKRESTAKKIIKKFKEKPELLILHGRYGPYITYKKKNFKIPKSVDPKELKLDDCLAIIKKKKF